MTRTSIAAAAIAGVIAMASCAVGPAYRRPDVPVPAAWDPHEPWRVGAPADALPKGRWWAVFRDADLDALVGDALRANQSIAVAAARLGEARGAMTVARSALYPGATFNADATRQRVAAGVNGLAAPVTTHGEDLRVTVSYEMDLFGARRRSIENAQALVQAAAADLQNAQLLIAAEVAADYFTLRRLDTEIKVLDEGVTALNEGLRVIRARHDRGIASGLDVAQEEALLEGTRTQAILVQQQRDEIVHALAVLTGKPAPGFAVPVRPLRVELPAIPAELPSGLLERRPDIAASERRVAAANASIGAARAAYFPSLGLSADAGSHGSPVARLLTAPSRFWALGVELGQDLFTGGQRRGRVQIAQAAYEATVAEYRASALRAFQEVEDALTGLAVLDRAARSQAAAVEAAQRTLAIAQRRYEGGLVSSLDVVTAQQTLLGSQRQAAQIDGARLVTAVQLIRALGGGWNASELPIS